MKLNCTSKQLMQSIYILREIYACECVCARVFVCVCVVCVCVCVCMCVTSYDSTLTTVNTYIHANMITRNSMGYLFFRLSKKTEYLC